MEIQKVLWPQVGICTNQDMYFRKNKYVTCGEAEKLFMKEKAEVWFDTYFNGVSIGKWTKYTVLKTLSLCLRLKGKGRVLLLQKIKVHERIVEKVLVEKFFDFKQESEIKLDFPEAKEGMLFFKLEAFEENTIFYGGYYYSEIPKKDIRDVKIGIDICTFKREKFIEHNLEILNQYILKNPDSKMFGKLEIFISDNGKTLERERLATEQIHIVQNKNTGGAGGFTRGLLEILKVKEKSGITHALIMDDDVVIDPESIVKTYTVLSLLKEEYQSAFIGGAMLRLDFTNIQVESGAVWNGGKLVSLKSGLDLASCEACLYNEVEEYREFNAWWYCCFPVSVVTEENLPLPIFIRGDDLEYGLRNMKTLILMNGICVWHEPFENKYSSFLNYYILRNQLIDNSLHCEWYGKKQLCKDLVKRVTTEILYYRYKNVDLLLRGVEDFLKGVDFLLATDGEALHKEIMAAGYRAEELEKLPISFSYPKYDRTRNFHETRKNRWKRKLTINGYLLRAKYTKIVPMVDIGTQATYRAKKVMFYDATTQKAFVEEKSYKKVFSSYMKLLKVLCHVIGKYEKAKKDYRAREKELSNRKFWEGYLG